MKQVLPLFLLVSLLASCIFTGSNIPDPHKHSGDIHEKPWSVLESCDIRLILVERPPDAEKKNIVLNQSKSFRAYVTKGAAGKGAGPDLIWIEDLRAGRTYEIQGIPLPHRPFSGLKWVEDKFFVFDRWSNPHYGMHYVVNAAERKAVLARSFSDHFYLDSQRKESEGNN